MKLGIVVLNWNAGDDTIRCVRRLSLWRTLQPQVWVVDNASQDGSVAAIRRELPEVRLICNRENLGFSGGTNRGIEAILTQGEVPILMLNNDAQIDEESVAYMLESLHPDLAIGVVGPLLYEASNPGKLISAGNKNPVLHYRNLNTKVPPNSDVFVTDYVSGSVALFRPEVFGATGLLDEAYFFNTEVADICRRARQVGYACVVDTRARAYHDLDRSSDLRGTLYTYYLIRNRFIYIRKFYRALCFILSTVWAVYSLLLAGKLHWDGRSASATAVWLGLRDGLQGRYGGQNERVLAACGIVSKPPARSQSGCAAP